MLQVNRYAWVGVSVRLHYQSDWTHVYSKDYFALFGFRHPASWCGRGWIFGQIYSTSVLVSAETSRQTRWKVVFRANYVQWTLVMRTFASPVSSCSVPFTQDRTLCVKLELASRLVGNMIRCTAFPGVKLSWKFWEWNAVDKILHTKKQLYKLGTNKKICNSRKQHACILPAAALGRAGPRLRAPRCLRPRHGSCTVFQVLCALHQQLESALSLSSLLQLTGRAVAAQAFRQKLLLSGISCCNIFEMRVWT